MTTVRRARNSDSAFIVQLSEQVFSEYSLRAGQRALPLTQGRGVITVVAEWRKERAGFAVLRCDARGTGHLDAIAVTELARGHGVGRKLLAEIEAQALERELRRLELVTADSNLAALMLFHRAG